LGKDRFILVPDPPATIKANFFIVIEKL